MSEPRHILVTNDDGIDSPGLWTLAEAMSEIGQVLVVAPAAEASGTGTMVTTRRDLQIAEVPARIDGVKAYTVDGTPADCVLVGLRRLKEGWISVLASGINHGPNLGVDLFLSGTCGAALIGAFRHLTSLAISLDLQATDDGLAEPRWATAGAVARALARGIPAGPAPCDASPAFARRCPLSMVRRTVAKVEVLDPASDFRPAGGTRRGLAVERLCFQQLGTRRSADCQ